MLFVVHFASRLAVSCSVGISVLLLLVVVHLASRFAVDCLVGKLVWSINKIKMVSTTGSAVNNPELYVHVY